MAKRLALFFQILSLVLLCVIGVEVHSLIFAKAPLEDLEPGTGTGGGVESRAPGGPPGTPEGAPTGRPRPSLSPRSTA